MSNCFAFLVPTEFLPISNLIGVAIVQTGEFYSVKVRYKDIDGDIMTYTYEEDFITLNSAQHFVNEQYDF